jgi:hypothetical protein
VTGGLGTADERLIQAWGVAMRTPTRRTVAALREMIRVYWQDFERRIAAGLI